MTKLFWNVFRLSPVVLAATFFAANSAFAGEATEKTTSVAELSEESNNIGQVTSVSQFTDVQPTDWAFQALQSLVERYGCIAGYPNSTFRGNRALTRYEFAAGLNACLDRINELIAIATEKVGSGDLETLKRLQEEYAAELATLRGRVDGLEFRTAELEANQFSTTAKLKGKVEFITGGVFGEKPDGTDVEDEITLGYRTRLDITSSFTGNDKLRVRLHQRDNASYGTDRTGTNMSRIDVQGDTDDTVEVEKLKNDNKAVQKMGKKKRAEAKKKYYREKYEKCRGNQNEKWRFVKQILNKNSSNEDNKNSKLRSHDGSLMEDQNEIVIS